MFGTLTCAVGRNSSTDWVVPNAAKYCEVQAKVSARVVRGIGYDQTLERLPEQLQLTERPELQALLQYALEGHTIVVTMRNVG